MKENAKYIEIENHIKMQILSGKLRVGDQIPTEKQLAEEFNTSRMTVNKAILRLVGDRYIERTAGKGSFVINPHVSKTIESPNSFTKDMESIGLVAGSKLIDFRILRAKEIPDIAGFLEISNEDEFIYYFVRLRTGNGTPIAISYTYVKAAVVPALDINALNGSFYKYLEDLGVKIKSTSCEMSAVLPTEMHKKLLKIKDTALLKNSHVTYLEDGKPFEYIDTYYIGSRYSYKFKSVQG
ncbi:MAG: GntR family transcriptional regulator [Bacillota bacterium]|nr:GntR family transcriptional regulator [Bacillota bacterium]